MRRCPPSCRRIGPLRFLQLPRPLSTDRLWLRRGMCLRGRVRRVFLRLRLRVVCRLTRPRPPVRRRQWTIRSISPPSCDVRRTESAIVPEGLICVRGVGFGSSPLSLRIHSNPKRFGIVRNRLDPARIGARGYSGTSSYCTVQPPSTVRDAPVMLRASCVHKNTVRAARSSTSTNWRVGWALRMISLITRSSGMP